MRVKLTDALIRTYRPHSKLYAVGDAACPGLRLRVTPRGTKSFVYAYRDKVTDRIVYFMLGHYPDMMLAEARERANDARKWNGHGAPMEWVAPRNRKPALKKVLR